MARLRDLFNFKIRSTRTVWWTGLGFILGFLVLAILSIQMWEYTNSVAFCAYTCHDVHPEEPAAYMDSYHARVKCTECHMGRVNTLNAIVIKASHNRHLPEVIFDKYERPLESKTMRPANESCERCHWPPAFHGDTVRHVRRFLPDPTNTETNTYLILKTGGGEREKGLGYGIHWHINNRVEYIATGEQRQEIAWIRSTLPDGRIVVYQDVTNRLSTEQIATAEKRVMDCVDCHNRVGHPFPYPADAIDQSMAENEIDTDLPFLKFELQTILETPYSDQIAAQNAIDTFGKYYRIKYADAAEAAPSSVEQANEVLRELLPRLVFEEPGVTWQSFPDNSGHKEFAGCFRCHDGKHLSEDGESIRLHCNICHSIPQVVGENERPPQMPVASIQEPDSHLATNYMADHRFQADDSCAVCHTEVIFGSDNQGFCSNSACHGTGWPSVELDAAFPHPITLEGKHARVWCHDCHVGETKPIYVCANCHQPPQGHFEEPCESCHTPLGWPESARISTAAAPQIPHSLVDRSNCLECHERIALPKDSPFNHAGYSVSQCTFCHKPS